MKQSKLSLLKAQCAAFFRKRCFSHENDSNGENSKLHDTVSMYIKYFSSEETREELKNNGVTVSLGLPFRLEQSQIDTQGSQTYTINKFGTPIGSESDKEEVITATTQITYASDSTLQSVVFMSETGSVVESSRNEANQWTTSVHQPSSEHGLTTHDRNLPLLNNQMFFVLKDMYNSYLPVVETIGDLPQSLDVIEKFKAIRAKEQRAGLFLVRK